MLCSSRCTLSGDIQFWNILLLMMFSLIIWLRWRLQIISIVRYLGENEVLWEVFFLIKMSIYIFTYHISMHSWLPTLLHLLCIIIHGYRSIIFKWRVTVSQLSFSSVHFSHSVVSNSLRPHGLHHARLPCPSSTSGACSNSCPSSQWCHPTILCIVLCIS